VTEPASATCPACSAAIEPGAAFCASCGATVAGPSAGQPPSAGAPPLQRPSFGDAYLRRDRTGRVNRAAKWLAGLAVLFLVFGTVYGFHNKSQVDEARETLAPLDDAQVLEVEGESYTVAELETRITRELYLVFGINYFLAVVMFGLFLWARRSPLPAMVTGLCVYLAVIVLNAIVEPASLIQGILIKVLFIGALIAGIKAALEERDQMRGDSPGRAP